MKCEICGKEILRDSQCINYKYYHNDCIENLEKQNNQLKCNWNKLKEYLDYKSERAVGEDEYVYVEIYNKMQEIEKESNSNEITRI